MSRPARRAPTLDLRGSHPGLTGYQRRFFDDGLGADTRGSAFEAFSRQRYTADQLAYGLTSWQMRTLDEYRSQVGFTELLSELTELEVPFDVLTMGVRLVRDEARHVELCRRMVVALGGSDVIPGTPHWVRSDRSLPVLMRVLRSVAGSLCVGETISTAFLVAVRATTTDPLARAVLTVLTADESMHSRIGWSLLPQLLERATAKQRRALQQILRSDFEVCFEVAGGEAGRASPDFVRSPFGELSPTERRRVFLRSMQRDVVRPFEAAGIEAGKAWAAVVSRARRSAAT